ncbi:MAG TPA: hypothetical protein VFB60_09415 [Ktedonobacteraceae bacterium]|nr:hypothetical protein [Ktedonobacteraceae bacterium]
MYTETVNAQKEIYDISSNMALEELYAELRALVRYLVGCAHVPSWEGQQNDIVEDVVQETMRRLLERVRKGESGEKPPVQSLKHMMIAIAQNHCRDLRRRDCRLSRWQTTDTEPSLPRSHVGPAEPAPLLDAVTETVYHERLFGLVAQEVEQFPNKQRTALLVDLANLMHFDEAPTPLQAAFSRAGIQLQQYQQPLPEDPRDRSRHTSLLSHAYKRVAHLRSIEEYTSDREQQQEPAEMFV